MSYVMWSLFLLSLSWFYFLHYKVCLTGWKRCMALRTSWDYPPPLPLPPMFLVLAFCFHCHNVWTVIFSSHTWCLNPLAFTQARSSPLHPSPLLLSLLHTHTNILSLSLPLPPSKENKRWLIFLFPSDLYSVCLCKSTPKNYTKLDVG